ncbi:MAG: hypothetical protein JW719_08255 [Pirellulales bacterium]|nr:hypothetical protein [Pirellulales bacterium]
MSVLTLSAVYLSVVVLGHCFHNHGHGCEDGCGCVASCRAQGNAHDYDEPPADESSPMIHVGSVSDNCPICQFFSHHSLTVVAAGDVFVDGVLERIPCSAPAVAAKWASGVQQPRAPPFSA